MKITPELPESSCLVWLLSGNAPLDPCFVLDESRLLRNAKILEYVQEKSSAKILLALKAFSSWPVFPLLSRTFAGPLWGVCASSIDEARLGREKFGGEAHAFAAAWSLREIEELLRYADHIVFNSLTQWERFKPICLNANLTFRKHDKASFGLRLNPEASQGATAIYNPCAPGSRLGVRKKNGLTPENTQDFEGLHFHALCEQGAEDLENILKALEKNFANILCDRKWLNFGGGHHITRPGYNLELLINLIKTWRKKYNCQIYLEPGEAVALNAGWLSATVLDVVEADMPIAILDVSAACHMPDVLEMPYTPPLFYKDRKGKIQSAAIAANTDNSTSGIRIRFAGKSCLAGDIIGEYFLSETPEPGTRLVFGDMGIYSMVKTNTFNGLRLPDIGIFSESGFRMQRKSSYEDFFSRLG